MRAAIGVRFRKHGESTSEPWRKLFGLEFFIEWRRDYPLISSPAGVRLRNKSDSDKPAGPPPLTTALPIEAARRRELMSHLGLPPHEYRKRSGDD